MAQTGLIAARDKKDRDTYVDLLVLKEWLAKLKRLPALGEEALVALPTDLIFHDFRVPLHQNLLYCVLLLADTPARV